MRVPWNKSKVEQRDLVDEANEGSVASLTPDAAADCAGAPASATAPSEGLPLLVSVQCLEEDPRNPRKEFPEWQMAELAEDIALRGILQPIVVHRLADAGRRILFGAKRLRAAKQAGRQGSCGRDCEYAAAPGAVAPKSAGATDFSRESSAAQADPLL